MSAADVIQGDALFRSAHEALTFAFRFSGQQYPLSLMARMMRGILGSGRGLVGLDGALQAGLICRMLNDLPHLQRMVIEARYADHEDRRWLPAVNALTMSSVGAVSGLSHRIARQALIARYFGHRVNLGEIAEKCAVSRNTLAKMQWPVRDYLRGLEEKAYGMITDMLQQRGVIEG